MLAWWLCVEPDCRGDRWGKSGRVVFGSGAGGCRRIGGTPGLAGFSEGRRVVDLVTCSEDGLGLSVAVGLPGPMKVVFAPPNRVANLPDVQSTASTRSHVEQRCQEVGATSGNGAGFNPSMPRLVGAAAADPQSVFAT